MQLVKFNNKTHIHTINLDNQVDRVNTLKDVKVFLETARYSPQDNYNYLNPISVFDFNEVIKTHNNIDSVIKLAIKECIELENLKNKKNNKINVDSWINIVRSKNPKQIQYKKNNVVILHNHVDIQNNIESFYPNYTFVYYAQMPDNLLEDEGTLILGDGDGRYYHLPLDGDLIIMDGGVPHSPNISPNSTKDRIVIAGNVGFEYIKMNSTFI